MRQTRWRGTEWNHLIFIVRLTSGRKTGGVPIFNWDHMINLNTPFRWIILTVLFSLCTASAALGQTASGPPRTIADLLTTLERQKPDPGKIAEARVRLQATPPESALKTSQFSFYNSRGWAAQALGDVRQEISNFEKAAEVSQGTPDYLTALQALSNAQMSGGNRVEGLRTRGQLIALASREPGRLLTLHLALIITYAESGELEQMREARSKFDANFSLARNLPNSVLSQSFFEAMYQWGTGVALQYERKPAEAEVAFRRSLAAFQRDQENARLRASRAFDQGAASSILEISARNWDYAEGYFARFLISRERLDEAEMSLRQVLTRQLQRIGRYNMNTASALVTYAVLLRSQGRFSEAAQLARLSEETLMQAGVVSESGRLAEARRALASALVAQELWPQAFATYSKLRAGLANDPASLALLGRGDFDWALTLVKTGQADQALAMLQQEIKIAQQFFGNDSSQVAMLRGLNGMALAAVSRRSEAFTEFSAAVKVLFDPPPGERDLSPGQALRLRRVLEGYIGFLHEASADVASHPSKIDPVAEAFRAADLARSQGTQRALAQSAARAAVDNPLVGSLVRKEQDMEQEVSMLYGFLLGQMNLPTEQQLPRVQADMRKRIDTLTQERKALRNDIEKRFPKYADLINPRPATLGDAKKALALGEVIVSVFSTSERSYVWAIRASGETGFHAAPLGEKAIAERVASLRKALDPGDVLEVPPYDLATAHGLYAELFLPLEKMWDDSHTLVVSASGSLSQLPLSVLVTRPYTLERGTKLFQEYRQVPWLARKLAVSYTPSVTAFAQLRTLPAARANRKPFIAFADPVFGSKGQAGTLRSAGNRLGLRNVQSSPFGKEGAQQGVDWHEYSELAALPDTREEVMAIATALGADPQKDLFLGLDANRKKVLETDLSDRRIVAFATHGLIPGDLSGLHQPALALSAFSNSMDSPLLTLEDVLRLKLDADWVILSACNTASGDGQGSEAISGLGRGFFYAGTRALLVTHWPVETVSAKLLTTGVFQRYAKTPGISRAKALQGAMLELLQDLETGTQTYSHPLFWAPYALVGDSG